MDRMLSLLHPLDRFYARAGRAVPDVRPLPGEAIPEPYRHLLVHTRSMTQTLEAFHEERTHLQVLAHRQEGEALWRQVVLRLHGSGQPVEFAAIVIHLQHFPADAREEILAGRRPLGSILNGHHIECRHSPALYLCLRSDRVINEALHLPGPQPVYGRRNVLRDEAGTQLAQTLEIVPPVAAAAECSREGGASSPWLWPTAPPDWRRPYRRSPVVTD
jgi:chorismate-pyruvate lyase